MPPNGKTASSNGSRFELPQLTPVNFSLTDGTNIPPPPDSPIAETPPPPISKEVENTPAPVSKSNGIAVANGNGNGTNGAHYEREPLSPASSKRPSSIRRFLSRRSLNANYTNGTNHNGSAEDLGGIPRPESAMSFSPSLARKKSGSWFRKPWGGKRTSIVMEDKISAGPPPPKLPELAKVVGNEEGSFGGDDLFKNIK